MRYIHIYIFVLHNHFIVVAFILRYNILKETEKKKKRRNESSFAARVRLLYDTCYVSLLGNDIS